MVHLVNPNEHSVLSLLPPPRDFGTHYPPVQLLIYCLVLSSGERDLGGGRAVEGNDLPRSEPIVLAPRLPSFRTNPISA